MSRRQNIEHKLRDAFAVEHVDVVDESHRHNVPAGAESHFKVTLASPDFDGQALIARHRAVNRTLKDELAGPVHALALHLFSPREWSERNASPESSPCLGGERNHGG